MKILVTGSNGYIGSRVVKQLCDFGFEVVATDIANSNIDKRAFFVKANVFDKRDDWFDFFKRPDVCLHLAWRDGFIHNSSKHIVDLPDHYLFLTNLIDGGLKTVAIMGTMHEVGYWEGSIDENTPCNPLSNYGIAKNALRSAIQIYAEEHSCNFMWLRAFYIYGDDLFGNSIFCKLRQASANGQTSFPFTKGENKYDFIHIDDLANQIARCVTQNSVKGIINCCSGHAISLSKQIEWYIRKNNLNIKLEYGKYPDRPYDSPCVFGNNKKIQSIINPFVKIMITGCNGQLGSDCIRELQSRGYKQIFGVDVEDFDISNEQSVKEYVSKINPDVVIHCAAWTSVDKAEFNEEKVFSINSYGTKYIADACKENNAKLVYISTDYVFDGNGSKPFEINDPKGGLSIYGKSKSLGEDYVVATLQKYFIVRISWAFGKNGNNFVKTMIKFASSGKKRIYVVDDQVGSVTYTKDLAVLLCDMLESDKYGVYHATNEGYLSWADFAIKIFEKTGSNVEVVPVSTEKYKELVPSQAARPLNSRLSKKSLDDAGFARLPFWEDALERFLKEIPTDEKEK